MTRITDKTVKSKYPPKQTNVTWIDTSQKPAVTKSYIDGQWVVVGGGVTDYNDIKNKPSINGVELDGNKTSSDLGVYSKPSSGIPESDLSSDVQSQLNKHFKGWFASVGYLETEYPSPVVGDYAYVKGAESTDPAAIYECTTAGSWSDSGRTADTSNVQTFASSQEVNEVHIVNDLTTGGVDDVLSAEQGKTLEQEVSQLDQEVNKIDVNFESIPTRNMFNKATVTTGKAVRKDTGELMTDANWVASDWIDVSEIEAGTIVKITAQGYGGVIGIAGYDSSKNYTGDRTSIALVSGDAYIRASVKATNIDTTMVYVGDTPSEYIPYGNIKELKDGIVSTKKVADNAIDRLKLADELKIYKSTAKAEWDGCIAELYIPEYYASTLCVLSIGSGIKITDMYANVVCVATISSNNTIYPLIVTGSVISDYPIGKIVGYVIFSDYARFLANPYSLNVDGVVNKPFVANLSNSPRIAIAKYGNDIKPELFVPNKITAVVGDTLQIFYKGIVKAVNPLNYNIKVTCSKGRIYHRYWEYTPQSSDIGNTTLTVYVRNDYGEVLSTKSCTLVTVAAPVSPSSTTKVVCVGASETANGIWVAEFYRRLTGTGGTPVGEGLTNVDFCGPLIKDGAGYIGKSGWGWVDYATQGRPAFRFTVGTTPNISMGNVYTNNGYSYTVIEISDNGTILCSTSSASNTPQSSGTLVLSSGSGDAAVTFTESSANSQNPFWDYSNNKLTFVPYANTYCGGTISVMYVCLGVNDLTSAFQTNFSTIEGYVKSFADTLHAEFPNAKLVLLSYCLPSMELMMPGYGASGAFSDTYGILCSIFELQKLYQEIANDTGYSGFVDYVNLASQVDSDYNFPITEKNVNTRNSTKQEPYANNTIHAGENGYKQFSDAAYRNFATQSL